MQRQAVLFDLGWTLVVPRSGDWMLTPLFEQTFPAWREAISPAEMEWVGMGSPGYIDPARGINRFSGNLGLTDDPRPRRIKEG